jgi:hypothetical protein
MGMSYHEPLVSGLFCNVEEANKPLDADEQTTFLGSNYEKTMCSLGDLYVVTSPNYPKTRNSFQGSSPFTQRSVKRNIVEQLEFAWHSVVKELDVAPDLGLYHAAHKVQLPSAFDSVLNLQKTFASVSTPVAISN